MKIDLLPGRDPVCRTKVGDLLWPAPLREVTRVFGKYIPFFRESLLDVEGCSPVRFRLLSSVFQITELHAANGPAGSEIFGPPGRSVTNALDRQ